MGLPVSFATSVPPRFPAAAMIAKTKRKVL